MVEFSEPEPFQLPALVRQIKLDKLENPLRPMICGVGFLGIGKHNKEHRAHNHWLFLLDRCYSNKVRAYRECTVCKDWHNFQNYARWYDRTYIEGYQLDKDIKVEGNKHYSPRNCLWVPTKINQLFQNFNYNLIICERHRRKYRTHFTYAGVTRRETFNTKPEARGQYFIWRSRLVWRESKKLGLDPDLLKIIRGRCVGMLEHGKKLMGPNHYPVA